ncbi:MAG: TetR/AcrR family transcriptional regulator [Campylobacterales bacterium]|nr:TetR/AcrR family transcriptional regulator [Campylobacterales bacterium]
MSPKIVNKDKRREILALLVYENIIKIGIKKFSIDSFVKEQKIGKSSFYNYFKSKDEAICYVLSLKTKEYINKCKKEIDLNLDFQENLYQLFDTYLNKKESNLKDLALFKEFVVLYQDFNNENFENLNKYYFTNMQILIKRIIEDAVNKKILKKEAIEFSESLLVTADGMMFFSFSLEDYDLEMNLKKYINNFIKLVRI